MSVDAIAYTPSDRVRTPVRRADDVDMAATLRRVIAERERPRREAESGGDADISGGLDLLPALPMSSDAAPMSAASVDLGGVLPVVDGTRRVPFGGVRADRAATGLGGVDLAAPFSAGGDGSGGPGAIGEASLGVGPANLSTSVFSTGRSPVSLSLSPLSGLSLGLGGRAGAVGVGASPFTGVNLGVSATPSENSGVNLALATALRAAGIPLSLAIAKGLAPAAAAFTGPAGLAVQGFNSLIDLATAIAQANNVPTVHATLNAMRANDPETNAAILNNANAAVAQALATGVGPRVTDPQEAAVIAAQLNSFNGPVAQFSDGRGGWVTMAINTLNSPTMNPTNPSASNPGNFNLTTNFGRASGGADTTSVDPNTDPADVSQVVDLGGDAGGGGGSPGGGPGTGPGGSDGNAGAGPSAYLATWAMDGLGIGPGERKERGWAAFHRSFTKRFPLTGESQFRRYARLARQVVEALEERPVPEQMQARHLIYRRIVAPLGETLELHEIDEAWTAMRAVALDLAQRLGLTVDPADVPKPAHELTARARRLRDERRAKARAQSAEVQG